MKRIFIAGCLLLAAAAPAVEGDKIPSGKIIVNAVGLRSDKGCVRLTLFNSAKDYPTRLDKALQKLEVTIVGGKAQGTFSAVPYGVYAISMVHDENANGKMDMTFYKKPKEGHGASNDAKGFMGPPSFSDAKFALEGPELILNLKMQY